MSAKDSFRKLAEALHPIIKGIRRPYSNDQLGKLSPDQRRSVLDAEYDVFLHVSTSVGYTHDPSLRQKMEAKDMALGDAHLIDAPLEAQKQLAATYQNTGLAVGEKAAADMAAAFTQAIAEDEKAPRPPGNRARSP